MRRLKKRFSAIMSLISEGRRNTRRLCSIAGVSPKCYYAHAKGPSGKEMSDERLIAIIRALQETYGNSLGYRKMADRINDDYGIVLGRKKVLRLMEEANALSAVRRKHFSEEYYLARRQMKENAPPDLIGRHFFALEPYRRLVCDMTYLTGSDTTWYLSVIEDLFNGEILAWKVGEHCNTQLVVDTVEMLRKNVGNLYGCILHSDGGSVYSSYDYREILASLGIRQSMGVKLTCYDNARIESFNGVFKTEALYASLGKTKVNSHMYTARELAAKAEWFIPYYNDNRRKDGLNHMTPVEYRESNPRGTYPVVVENNL